MRLRSPYDRQIFRLALPALGALAAEPLYILVDTAIVGHLGRSQLAALGAAATALSVLATFNFLQYATTAQVARASGAGEERDARRLGAQALWLSLAVGLVLAATIAILAPQVVALVGVEGQSADYAATYLRIVAIGVPSFFLALGGQGFLRGVADLTSPLVVIVAANVVNLVLEVLFVYVFHWGIAGSAAGTAIAQGGMAAAFVIELLRPHAPSRRPSRHAMKPLFRIGRQIFVRTVALYASFLFAASLLARMGDAQIGAHQIGYQLFLFIALVLDAVAIAGQVIVGRMLGAGDADGAYAAGVRMIGWSVAVGIVFALVLAPLSDALPQAFTDDRRVLHEAALLWPFLAAMQPLGGAVFALDGILIGAGDTRYLMWSMVAASAIFIVLASLAYALGWGVVGVWAALDVLLLARLALLGPRFVRRRWAVVGWD